MCCADGSFGPVRLPAGSEETRVLIETLLPLDAVFLFEALLSSEPRLLFEVLLLLETLLVSDKLLPFDT